MKAILIVIFAAFIATVIIGLFLFIGFSGWKSVFSSKIGKILSS